MQKHVSLVGVITLIFKKIIGFYEGVPPLRELRPFGLDPLTNWDQFSGLTIQNKSGDSRKLELYSTSCLSHSTSEIRRCSWASSRFFLATNQHDASDITASSLTSGWIKLPSMSKSTPRSTSTKFCLVS